MVSFNCNFDTPVTFDGAKPTTKQDMWHFKNENCSYNSSIYAPTTTIASSTAIQLYGSFTAGEIVMSFLMFMLIVIELGKIIANGLNKINTHKKFLHYGGGDVELTDDII